MTVSPGVAAIADALRQVTISGIFYCPSYLREPWGLTLPAMTGCVWFHAVSSGSCVLEVGGQVMPLGPGDFVLVPHGTGHRIAAGAPTDHPVVTELPHEEHAENFAVLRYGADGPLTELVCGGLRLEHPSARRLIDALPPVVPVHAARHSPLRATLDLLAGEMHERALGADAVIGRLCDIVVIQAIRHHLVTASTTGAPWLVAMSDPGIGPALAALHADPAARWSVASLASRGAMSRSAFAERFTRLLGQPAMSYVTDLRLQCARDMLARGELTVSEIARAVGYESDPAFGRAFKRRFGISPRRAAHPPA